MLVLSIMNMSGGGRQYQQYGCSGTLIRRHLVVTAASCLFVRGHQDNPDYKDTLVMSRLSAIQYKAKWLYIHPEYQQSSDYNIAVIEIETVDENINLPRLPTSLAKFKNVKDTCTLAGFGSLKTLTFQNFHFTDLKDTGLKMLECRKTSKDFMVCVHFESLYPCEGDVGSPLICDGELFAIFTPKYMIQPSMCMDRYGAMFTPIHPFIEDWLQRILDVDHHDKLEWMNNPLNILFLSGVILALIGVIYYLIMGWINRRARRPGGSLRLSSMTSQQRSTFSSVQSGDRVRWA